MSKLKMWDTNQYVEFEPNRAAEISLEKGCITVQRRLTAEEIIEEFGHHLTNEQLAILKAKMDEDNC